jgi:hypothetical protein
MDDKFENLAWTPLSDGQRVETSPDETGLTLSLSMRFWPVDSCLVDIDAGVD